MIEYVTLTWEWFKDWLSASVGLTHYQLHVVVGLTILTLASLLFRWRLASGLPLLMVAILELGNEILDYTRYARAHWPWQRNTTLIEVALTLAAPLLLTVLDVLRRRFSRRTTPVGATEN